MWRPRKDIELSKAGTKSRESRACLVGTGNTQSTRELTPQIPREKKGKKEVEARNASSSRLQERAALSEQGGGGGGSRGENSRSSNQTKKKTQPGDKTDGLEKHLTGPPSKTKAWNRRDSRQTRG